MGTSFSESMSMDDMMRIWPQTIRVILDHHMLCVGCPIARFQTVSDACKEHCVDKDRFLEDIRRVIGAG